MRHGKSRAWWSYQASRLRRRVFFLKSDRIWSLGFGFRNRLLGQSCSACSPSQVGKRASPKIGVYQPITPPPKNRSLVCSVPHIDRVGRPVVVSIRPSVSLEPLHADGSFPRSNCFLLCPAIDPAPRAGNNDRGLGIRTQSHEVSCAKGQRGAL